MKPSLRLNFIWCRFGTCGGIAPNALPGTVVVASMGAAYVSRNVDAFTHYYENSDSERDVSAPRYRISAPVPSCPILSLHAHTHLSSVLGAQHVVYGLDVTADSFYSGQGRIDPNFYDCNEDILEAIRARYPDAASLEMETFMLFHLAQCCRKKVYATAATIVMSNRASSVVVDGASVDRAEREGGLALLKAIIEISM
jgi:uridine phosphorylase